MFIQVRGHPTLSKGCSRPYVLPHKSRLPMNEELRLQELHHYQILFTEPEAAFDRIVELTRRLFQVPVVLISFIDRDIQWFKSCIGLDVPGTSRDVSFCSHAIEGDQILVVPDALADPRFKDNPLVEDPGIRFYAGAPLANARGFRLGTLCVIDFKPHPEGLDQEAERTLSDLAALTISELELRLANRLALQKMTALQTAERELQLANERLTVAMADLARSNTDLERFAQVCSHDLQAPARTTGQFLQLLMRRSGELLDEESQTFVRIASENAGRMVRLVDDVLAYSKAAVSDAVTERQSVDVNEIVQSALDNLAGEIAEANALVSRAALPVVAANPQFLLQIFQNLISNAIHYRGELQPRIQISHSSASNEEIFCVADNGIGIAAVYHQSIFEPFKRLHGPELSGSGVGLAICKALVERAHGRIWVESDPPGGAKFFFSFPA